MFCTWKVLKDKIADKLCYKWI